MEAPGKKRCYKTAGEYAADRRDTEVQCRSRRPHHILQRLRDRRDEGERGDRRRIEFVGTEIAGRNPSGGDQKSRPFRVISAAMPSTITTTNERRLPRPSSTSAREPQPFDNTM